MISIESFFDSNIKRVCEEYKTPYELTQRAIYALWLVEALRKVGLDFIFKGGSSMMLLFETPKRLSTDADILVSPPRTSEYLLFILHFSPNTGIF